MEAEAEAGATQELVAKVDDELAAAGAAAGAAAAGAMAAVAADDGRMPRSSMSRMRGAYSFALRVRAPPSGTLKLFHHAPSRLGFFAG